jgi:hypothetical protein
MPRHPGRHPPEDLRPLVPDGALAAVGPTFQLTLSRDLDSVSPLPDVPPLTIELADRPDQPPLA